MAARRNTKAREAQLSFEALSIEGGLLSPEWLSKVAQLQAGTQAEADYRIPKGLNLRDEIGRYWRIAQAHWGDFKSGQEAKADPKVVSERFVLALLRDAFGFTSLTAVQPAILAERPYPIGHAALGGHVPVVIAPTDSGLDALSMGFGAAGRKRSAFGLAQEYLNGQEGALWGIASDGTSLRIVRDNASLTRPAWIEADLHRIFGEERYADFAALWLLCHETRFGRQGLPASECALDAWRNAGREEGTRAREHLRRGVEDALVALGQGFLAHPENQALRASLKNGALPAKDYFNQLLRMVYRLIFLLTVEERGLLHPDGTSDAERSLYASGYSMRRLRERSVKRNAHDRYFDLWEATKVVCNGLAAGEPRLGLPALAGIFAVSQCPTLDAAKLENRGLLLAVFRLAWLREDRSLSRVNWRDMGPEELGSVYESLLELVPLVTQDSRQFAFATGGETKGNARKTTGSYYTPDSLVQVLLDSALEPVIADTIAKNPVNPIDALLGLSIVDPACGSGHFLLGAARRLAAHIARLQASGTPSAAEYRHALRQVVGHCIFGVDINSMAVELCKVGLWMEAVEPGLPLTFLDSHIQHGNALIGTTPELMHRGIPGAAWDPTDGDDTKISALLKKRNKAETGGQRTLDFGRTRNSEIESNTVTRAVAELDSASDAKLEELSKKETRWGDILGSPEYRHQKFVADTWCASFVWPKQAGELADAAPTNALWRQVRDGEGKPPELTTTTVGELAMEYRFFHWHLQFPQVFAKGGFDVVLGNPPWESLLFEEQEFFADTRPEIARAATAAIRKQMIAALRVTDPRLFATYRRAVRLIAGSNSFVRSETRFPLTGLGRVNLFALFAECARTLRRHSGRVGQILPSGLVTDDSCKLFFQAVIEGGELVSFLDFENTAGLFPHVHRQVRFGLLTLGKPIPERPSAEFVFFATDTHDLAHVSRRFVLSAEEIALLNPTTRTCPVFRSRREAEVAKCMYRKMPVLSSSGWRVELRRLLNSADDSAGFELTHRPGLLALYEGKYFHQFDHRWMTNDEDGDRDLSDEERRNPRYRIRPRYWYSAADVNSRFAATWKREWILGLRKITNVANERTLIASVLPSMAVSDSAKVFLAASDRVPHLPVLIANLGAFVLDYAARQKLSGWNMSAYVAAQLPVLVADACHEAAPWDLSCTLHEWVTPRVLELTYTAWDLEPFARDVGYRGAPFRWDPERRFLLRCELDAAFFHLYGLSREDSSYVMDAFPIVRKNDENVHQEFRTKRIILEIYDSLAAAVQVGRKYQTPLDPLPGTAGASHGTFAPDGTPKDYGEALRTGLLFALIRLSGDAGILVGALSRALLWLQDSKHAEGWLKGSVLTDLQRLRDSDALLTDGAADSQTWKLVEALETARTVTQNSEGVVRLRTGGTIPNWLPETPALAALAGAMKLGLDLAQHGPNVTLGVDAVSNERAKGV